MWSSGEKQSKNIPNYLAWAAGLQVETHTEVSVTEGEASSLTGIYYATISQHFLSPFPPPAADFYLITFTHSYPSSQYSSRDGEPLQGVWKQLSKKEKKKTKTLPPFNLFNAPLVSNKTSLSLSLSLSLSHSFTGSCGWGDVSVIKLLQVNRIFLEAVPDSADQFIERKDPAQLDSSTVPSLSVKKPKIHTHCEGFKGSFNCSDHPLLREFDLLSGGWHRMLKTKTWPFWLVTTSNKVMATCCICIPVVTSYFVPHLCYLNIFWWILKRLNYPVLFKGKREKSEKLSTFLQQKQILPVF